MVVEGPDLLSGLFYLVGLTSPLNHGIIRMVEEKENTMAITITGQLYSYVYRHYKGYKLTGVNQINVEGVGWYDTLFRGKENFEFLVEEGTDGQGRPIRVVTGRLFLGCVRHPFAPNL